MKIHFSHKEELWNSWSHFGGVVMGVGVGIAFLIFCIGHQNAWATAGVSLHALLVYSLNGVSCAERTERMEREIAQMGPCRHLLAYRRQLLATDADGTERGRRMGMGTVRVYMDVCHRGHGDEFQKTEGPQ